MLGLASLVSSLAVASLAGPGAGIDVDAALRLDTVIAQAIAHNPAIAMARSRRDAGAGAVQRAAAPFDLEASLFATGRDSASFEPASLGLHPEPLGRRELSQGLQVAKRWRSGLEVRPQISVSRMDLSTDPGTPPNRATAEMMVTMPVLRGRGGGLLTAAENAAARTFESRQLDLRHETARAVLETVSAYWSYLGAVKRLEVFTASEQRAGRLVEQTRQLVAADERAPAELHLPMANLATKRAVRTAASQRVLEARHALGLAMGLATAETDALPAPGTPFPIRRPADTAPEGDALGPLLARRADVLAAARREEGARDLRDAARRELRPRLDLALGFGYSGIDRGGAVGKLFSPLYRNVPGWNTSFALTIELPSRRNGAHGAVLQNEAFHAETRIATEEAARRAATGVRLALAALAHSASELRDAEEAVRFSHAAVESEDKKFQLGLSTLFETIQAEDVLTNALVSAIGAEQRHAEALARVRFETGRLLAPSPGREPEWSVDVAGLLGSSTDAEVTP